MNFIDIFIFTFFLTMLGVFFAKLYNLLNEVKLYGYKGVILSLVLAFFSWLIVLASMLGQVGDVLTALTSSVFMEIVSFLLVLNTMLSIAEIFFLYRNIAEQVPRWRERKTGRRM